MAYDVTCYSFLFFIDAIKPTYYNFCNSVTKAKKLQKLFDFLGTLCAKLLELYCDVTVKFSPILKEIFEQLTAKQQDTKVELASLF